VSSEEERPKPSERRLEAYLGELREHPPQSSTEIVERVSRSARWQRAVRAPLQVVAGMTAALFEGLGALLGAGRGSRRR
jgi:hypothetical protein